MTLQEIVNAAAEWVPKAPGNDWAIFDPIENETEQAALIREASKLLALRIDRSAPSEMIETQASRLAALINPPPQAPAFHYGAGNEPQMSLGARCLAGVALGTVAGLALRHGAGRHLVRAAVSAVAYQGVRRAMIR